MEHTNDSEEFDEWIQIEQHPSPETTSPTVHQSSVAWNTVVINDNYLQFHGDQSSVEGSLPNVPTTIDSGDGTSSTSAGSGFVSDEEGASQTAMQAAPPSDWRLRVANEGMKLLKLRFEAMRAGAARLASKVRTCAIWAGAFWSVTCVTRATAATAVAALLVSFAYLGIRRRRRRRRVGRQNVDHLAYLLQEKDEKISQLLLQIAQLNEVLSSRRRVPVLRISS